jgi:hypothetical protein
LEIFMVTLKSSPTSFAIYVDGVIKRYALAGCP